MLFSTLAALATFAASVIAAPVPHHARQGRRTLDLLERGHKAAHKHKSASKAKHGTDATAGPHFVYYADRWEDNGQPPAPADIAGWNIFAISFWLSTGPADMALGWMDLTADVRSQVKSQYAAAGIQLIVTAFGSTETPTSSGEDPTQLADSLATFVNQYDLDGVDVDYEDFDAMNAGTAVDWIVTFQTELRSKLGADKWISHAPVAPWFTNSQTAYPSGDYLQIDQQVGSGIDAYNIQFYNQGTGDYGDCGSLITTSNIPSFPGTALLEIVAGGIDQSKVVLGKPGNSGDASNGYIDPATLATCVQQAQAQGWNGGLMIWEFPDAPAGFIQDVWGSAPSGSGGSGGSGGGTTTSSSSSTSSVTPTSTSTSSPGGGGGATTTATSTSSAPSGTPSGGGTCTTSKAWDSATAYTEGSTVTYQGSLWSADSWSYNEVPGGSAQVWTQGQSC